MSLVSLLPLLILSGTLSLILFTFLFILYYILIKLAGIYRGAAIATNIKIIVALLAFSLLLPIGLNYLSTFPSDERVYSQYQNITKTPVPNDSKIIDSYVEPTFLSGDYCIEASIQIPSDSYNELYSTFEKKTDYKKKMTARPRKKSFWKVKIRGKEHPTFSNHLGESTTFIGFYEESIIKIEYCKY